MDTRIEDKPVIRSGDPAEPGEPLPTRQIGHETLPFRSFLSGTATKPIVVRQAIIVGLSDLCADSMARAIASGSWPSMRLAFQPADSKRFT